VANGTPTVFLFTVKYKEMSEAREMQHIFPDPYLQGRDKMSHSFPEMGGLHYIICKFLSTQNRRRCFPSLFEISDTLLPFLTKLHVEMSTA